MSNGKLASVRKEMGALGLSSLFIVKQQNIRYLTGFSGENSAVALTGDNAVLFVSVLYLEEAEAAVPEEFTIIPVDKPMSELAGKQPAGFWGSRTGYETETMTCAQLQRLEKAIGETTFVPANAIVEKFREQKTSVEIDAIIRAQHITDKVFEEVLSLIRPGVSERDLAIEVDYRFRKSGGERVAFDTIVASGPNSSKPHAVPSDRKIAPGDFVLFDMGTVINGYASDMTRTVVLGKADQEQRRVYSLVHDAQVAAIEAIHAGMKCSDAFRVAMNVFEHAGYAERFIHSLGHGVGLEVHEQPRVSATGTTSLLEQSVVTVEPGLYIPGWGGVRIEDMVVVTAEGCDNLTNSPKTLLEL